MKLKQTLAEDHNPIPFLRWAGGKRWFAKYLNDFDAFGFNNYHEPFLGGGSIFFKLRIKNKAFLSDLNPDLIATYKQLQENVEDVILKLKDLKNDAETYYRIRSQKSQCLSEDAARFIYLNQTSFNGIYRVNRSGEFNVPFGNRNKKDIVGENNLRLVSQYIKKSTFECCDFQKSLDAVEENDFVFIDPPYTVAHEKNGFIQYNQKIFSLEDQYRLASSIKEIIEKKAFFILTNAKHDAILDIYKDVGSPLSVSRSSTIGGLGATRGKRGFNEYVFSNCFDMINYDGK